MHQRKFPRKFLTRLCLCDLLKFSPSAQRVGKEERLALHDWSCVFYFCQWHQLVEDQVFCLLYVKVLQAGRGRLADTCHKGCVVSTPWLQACWHWRCSITSSDLTALTRKAEERYVTQCSHHNKVPSTHTHAALTFAVPVSSSVHVASHQLPHTENSLEMQRDDITSHAFYSYHSPLFLKLCEWYS